MSPAQSEDSGLAADRGTTYATISIPLQNAQALGLIFSGKINVSVFYMPFRIYYSSEMIFFFVCHKSLKLFSLKVTARKQKKTNIVSRVTRSKLK